MSQRCHIRTLAVRRRADRTMTLAAPNTSRLRGSIMEARCGGNSGTSSQACRHDQPADGRAGRFPTGAIGGSTKISLVDLFGLGEFAWLAFRYHPALA